MAESVMSRTAGLRTSGPDAAPAALANGRRRFAWQGPGAPGSPCSAATGSRSRFWPWSRRRHARVPRHAPRGTESAIRTTSTDFSPSTREAKWTDPLVGQHVAVGSILMTRAVRARIVSADGPKSYPERGSTPQVCALAGRGHVRPVGQELFLVARDQGKRLVVICSASATHACRSLDERLGGRRDQPSLSQAAA
jgi:hypothetical protein